MTETKNSSGVLSKRERNFIEATRIHEKFIRQLGLSINCTSIDEEHNGQERKDLNTKECIHIEELSI